MQIVIKIIRLSNVLVELNLFLMLFSLVDLFFVVFLLLDSKVFIVNFPFVNTAQVIILNLKKISFYRFGTYVLGQLLDIALVEKNFTEKFDWIIWLFTERLLKGSREHNRDMLLLEISNIAVLCA